MRFTIAFIIVAFFVTGCSDNYQEVKLPLKDGEYSFEHKFSEAEQHRIKSITLDVKITGNHIIVINNDRDDVFPKGVLEEGTLIWHSKTAQWIIGHKPQDKDIDEVGGCTDGPTVVDLKKRIYWTC